MILAAWLNNNLAAGISEDSKSKAPSFRAADGKHEVLTPASPLLPWGPPFDAPDDETPLEDASLSDLFSPHSFCVTGGHRSPQSEPAAQRLTNRRGRKVAQNIVERISIKGTYSALLRLWL